MRIIAGQWRGRKLASVGKGDLGAHLRPTPDRVRESLFSMLQGGRFGEVIEGARVLDLFAGTGALGLEALSRGAESAVFIENGKVALGLLRDNITTLKAQAEILRNDARRLGKSQTQFSLVFLDPPYGKAMGAQALLAAVNGGWIAPNALVVWEENAEQIPPPGFSELETKRYGDTWINVLRYDP